MNVIGEPIDECGPIGKSINSNKNPPNLSLYSLDTQSTLGIHREAPPFVDQSTEMEMLTTGIKVKASTFCSTTKLTPLFRSQICQHHIRKEEKLASSVVPVLVKLFLSWNSSIILPRAMVCCSTFRDHKLSNFFLLRWFLCFCRSWRTHARRKRSLPRNDRRRCHKARQRSK